MTKKLDKTRPATFDPFAWAAGRQQPEETTVVSRDPRGAVKLQRLTEQRDKAQQGIDSLQERLNAKAAEDQPSGRRLGQKDPLRTRITELTAELAEVDAQITALETALEGSWIEVRIYGLDPDDLDAIRKSKPDSTMQAMLTAQLVKSESGVRDQGSDAEFATLDERGWLAVFEAIGNAQMQWLDKVSGDLTFSGPDADFFTKRSASQPTAISSE